MMATGGEVLSPNPGAVEDDSEQPADLNISDVFEAISIADPSFQTAGGLEDAMMRPASSGAGRPYIRIVEQPASKALRFRYECEGRSAGSIPGATSTSEKKTFPTIEICGHKGRAIVVVSCVTKDKPYRPHPHNLVGRELCKKGVCTVNVSPDSGFVTFSNLGIQCVKRRDIEDALRVREELRVDPFKTGFSHKKQPQSIDLNAVRLCFQVFLSDERTGRIRHALAPVVSDVIYDKKAMSDLVITKLSHCSGSVMGGDQVILLCEKVAREDIAVTFFEKSGEQVTWQEDAKDVYVHRQVAICFTTPPYRGAHANDHVQVFVQLRRPTDNATSEPLPFELIPARSGLARDTTKRKKIAEDYSRYVPEQDMDPQISEYYKEMMALQQDKKIKLEPRDKTPPHQLTSPPPQLGYPRPPAPAAVSPARYDEQNAYTWMSIDNMQGGIAMPGPSHLSPYHTPQEIPWPNMAPNMGQLPQALSPINPALSPNMGQMSPNMGQVSPGMGHVSPGMGHVSPGMGHVSPGMGHVSPGMGNVSPNLAQMTPSMMHQQNMAQQPAALMEIQSDPPSITGLLLDRGNMPQLNSAELSGLSGFSGLLAGTDDRAPDMLTDSLRGLSTGDLLPQSDQIEMERAQKQ